MNRPPKLFRDSSAGITIHDVVYSINDYVVFSREGGKRLTRAIIRSDIKGNLYFRSRGRRQYLDNFMK